MPETLSEYLDNTTTISGKEIYLKVFELMTKARAMATVYDQNRNITKYVHSTSSGHEAIQISTGLFLKPVDVVYPYYRDDSLLLSLGFTPYELMLQLLAKGDDYFSGGRTYYSHPSSLRKDIPLIPHQSSATGMQAIPATGAAQGLKYLENINKLNTLEKPIVLCSLGDGCVTEGEVSEAFQMAVLKELPILYLVQDNDWGISANKTEMRAMDAYEYASGFKGLKREKIEGSDVSECLRKMERAVNWVRTNRKPILVHASVPLLGHHTSGVRMEWYRDDIELHKTKDPMPLLRQLLINLGEDEASLYAFQAEIAEQINDDFYRAFKSKDPELESVKLHEFAPTPVVNEKGERIPENSQPVLMVDAALHAIDEILKEFPEALFYGQDVGKRLGGVFREAATLAGKHGSHRVFNTPIQEAYIVGSTQGMSAVGCKPIVEIQFADYIWPAVNQLVTELSKSCYLSMGKFPIQSLIRIPTGAYGSGGPYHSGTVESSILQIKGIKVVYPSNAADMKGLMKAAFLDPNPVVMFEHKGLYWSKVHGTEKAKTPEPDSDYIIPLGKARIVKIASSEQVKSGNTCTVITYGMGVYWAMAASDEFDNQVEIIDLRTLNPCDDIAIFESVKKHGKVLVLTEETLRNSFAEALSGRIAKECFKYLDAPVQTLGSLDIPAVPLNSDLEKMMLPNAEKTKKAIEFLLNY
ncbi:MAG: tungsten formylmethanofuran dehydrogenase [Bacteroidetes bacterium]|nr:tungsten formylmethanofuran dehydrogenase [Bacteroidota bacterium]